MPPPKNIRFVVWTAETISQELLQHCAELFSENYGVWSEKGLRPGDRIRISAARLKIDYLFNPKFCSLITAELYPNKDLIGHAFVCTFPFLNGYAVWISQLVVREDMRRRGVATELICKSWTRDVVAWGLATSNPYSIRALERASQRRCDPEAISKHAKDLVSASGIPAFQNCKLSIDSEKSLIHCDFFVDHTNVNKAIAAEQNWTLGLLDEGDEFLAFCFTVENCS
ncbi:hypothetical protein DdX_14628 [Ditylenchus destructor]|uniref:N-acetyltransferase domain-containing protein n=1 Tax=Ditylenchus destructor TaxID=166010 RepID=A0AAD4MRV1_9BILA|nr:hypothetical protein DdX_14628 [Ditylenchus destructor]